MNNYCINAENATEPAKIKKQMSLEKPQAKSIIVLYRTKKKFCLR